MARKPFNLKEAIDRLDSEKVGLTVALLKAQIEQTAREFPKRVDIASHNIDSAVVVGMGGSALGPDVLRTLYEQDLKVPLVITHDYHLPAFVGRRTLVIAISYSGTTEEVLSGVQEARSRGARLFCITVGGKLGAYARRSRVPHYFFTEDNNPSRQPRMGLGYTMTATYLLLKKLRLLKPGHEDLIAASGTMEIDPGQALSLAKKTDGTYCILVAAEHLRGNMHVISNQINENAKIVAPFHDIPEMNHHLLEGMEELKKNKSLWRVIFFESDKYDVRNQKRFRATRQVLDRQGLSHISLRFAGSRAVQSLKVLQFGSYYGYYRAVLSGRNPASIPWVDHFKRVMKR